MKQTREVNDKRFGITVLIKTKWDVRGLQTKEDELNNILEVRKIDTAI